ncbi:MAG: AAA family ATPase [Deltaproteobacteria bacterium]|nr:AAA family ATPase [Deltaproteobacteria bacterium]
MKILEVRFKNLNSLFGEWHIDFTHPDYASDGIFAITGPTGAGKTTILDAVCLGLYGRTPRLDKVTKSSNEVMSRQSGECFAEVTFETQQGRYRCHWSQHRARKRPDGELQPAKHEVSEADTGTVLESRITQVGEFIEHATGMDFEQFTRSMLLAQGGFAAFLQASPDKRAPILEQITGTEIYTLISMKVHERRAEEQGRLESMLSELKGIQVLSPDEESALQTGLAERLAREAKLDSRLRGLRSAALWLEAVAALEKETHDLKRRKEDFEGRFQAFAPEAGRLDRSRRALGIEGDYRALAALKALQETETRELEGIQAALPEKEKTCAALLTAKQTSEALLHEARARHQSGSDVIRKVRELDARLSGQKRQLEDRERAMAEAVRLKREYEDAGEKAGQTLLGLQADLIAVHDYQAGHAADAALLTNLTAISRSFTSLCTLEDRRIRARETLAALAGKREAALAAFKEIESGHEKSRQEFAQAKSDIEVLSTEIAAILEGREISQWHREADTLKDRERLLAQATDAIERIDRTRKALEALSLSLEEAKTGQEKLSEKITPCAGEKALLESTIVHLETRVSLLSRIRDLEQERKRLEDGMPCPLCGAIDHPYARGNVPELNEAEAELKNARALFKQAAEQLSSLENERIKTGEKIEHAKRDRNEKSASLDHDEGECSGILLRLGLRTSPEDRAVMVREETAAVRSRISELSGIVAAAEDKGRREKSAQTALEELRAKVECSGKALQDARHDLETAGLEHERLSKEGEALEKEVLGARAAVLEDVRPFGVGQAPSNELDAILTDLTKRRDAWQAKLDEKTALDKKIADLKAAIDTGKALREKIEKDLATLLRERDDLLMQHGSLELSRRELFGDKDTDQEERRLGDMVDQAGKALEQAREEHGKSEKEIGALNEKAAALEFKTKNRAEELSQAGGKLIGRISLAGFADEADYLSACMNGEEQERLDALERSLVREKTELEALWKYTTDALATEREKHLTEKPFETLREEIVTCEADLKQVRLDIGGITKGLSVNEKSREKQQERLKSMDAQKNECARWDDLHELIGSADGKKFRNFAQGLTFEMMTVHANRQLRKMTDRYLLIRDAAQPLDLNVIDTYQAGEIRSTKNLSGGESFIVSLALALGLSQMASHKVRVDSLFLDEGFGTLDEDALETALETLAGLRQDGKLIGVISHVTALKERIGTQIQVTPETGGRSSLSGPGCRRV